MSEPTFVSITIGLVDKVVDGVLYGIGACLAFALGRYLGLV